jgi:hypothetical protein
MTAARSFLMSTDEFEVDTALEARLVFAAAPNGNLRCVKD